MGISRDWLNFTLDNIKTAGYELHDLKMCELGNQFIDVEGIPHKIAKKYFESLGVKHTSLDINGEDGALIIDLAKPIFDTKLLNNFDVITNFGTSEHIDNQYFCFRNMHNLLKKEGLFIHVLPKVGHWAGHCEFFYDYNFYKKIAEYCRYTVIGEKTFSTHSRLDHDLICAAMIKTANSKFINQEKFENLPIFHIKQKKSILEKNRFIRFLSKINRLKR